MRGTWARWRASVKRVSARREQVKGGAIAFLDASSEIIDRTMRYLPQYILALLIRCSLAFYSLRGCLAAY